MRVSLQLLQPSPISEIGNLSCSIKKLILLEMPAEEANYTETINVLQTSLFIV